MLEKLLLKLHSKKICIQCKKVLHIYDFEKGDIICRNCVRINIHNIYKERDEERKYLKQCIHCKSIKFKEWDDGYKRMLTCRRCGNTSFATHPDIKKVLKRRYRKN